MNIHLDSCGKAAAEVSVFTCSLWVFLVNKKYREFAPSDLPRCYMIVEEVASGQRPSASSAAGKIIATSRQMFQLQN